MLTNILKAPGRCSWFGNFAVIWSCRDDEWWFGLVGCFLFPFSPIWLCKDVRIVFVWNVGMWCNCFCHCFAALLCYWDCHTQIARDPGDASQTDEMFSFHSSCPCSALTCPLDIGISSLRTTSLHFLPVFRARNGIYFPWWALFCCAFKSKYDLIYV